MTSALVIVESPAKARTLERYLGSGYKVLASNGHVRDLLPKTGAVNPEQDFAMRYEIIDRNARSVDAIARALKKSDVLYLATDPDREGEAISWHLYELLRERDALQRKEVKRVVFHEVTKQAVLKALGNPGELSWDLINAQQARRALDYLVGFNLSPLLWKKIRRGLSAGRVQSPALRLIVEREEEIEQFQTREYWTVEADLTVSGTQFPARLSRFDDEKIEQFSITDEARAQAVTGALEHNAAAQLKEVVATGVKPGMAGETAGDFDPAACRGALRVHAVARKQRKRNPAPPFITSTLQQEAVRKLGFTAQHAMRIAQQLYEGIDIGSGEVGLITYMRTDSVNLATEAINEMRRFIETRYGAEYLPEKPRRYRTKSKNAQEAHEAIRPTSVQRVPQDLRSKLSKDQFRLYELIWKRALASQMAHAVIDTVAVDLQCGAGNLFRANGSTVVKKGFMALYTEGEDDRKQGQTDNATDRTLPAMTTDDVVALLQIRPEQHFTEPPPRYSEATLVKTLEEYGIGRPSTYAAIISTLRNREYVEMEKKRFQPTDVGRVVNKFLTEHFDSYVDYNFTARLEDDLDAVSRGEKEWVPLMRDFWEPFAARVKDKEGGVSRSEAVSARVLGNDPASGRPVTVRMGRYGPYVQVGTRDDEDKPKFASLRSEQRMDTIGLEEALELFNLPRELGVSEAGEQISVNIGRFGPYVRYDNKYASLQDGDDPYTIDLARALELVREKKAADANKYIKVFENEGIAILNGRYGPYIKEGKKNVKIPKDKAPEDLTLQECKDLIAAAPAGRRRRK
ncbi:MAG: DNA topoisomerase I [Gammaproteobacteria bacterium]|nr:DNA topoisomerase I [Gammaproteobacteria bacterium]